MAYEVTLDLVHDHLEHIGHVRTLVSELNNLADDDLADGNAPRHLGALCFERGVPPKRVLTSLAGLALAILKQRMLGRLSS